MKSKKVHTFEDQLYKVGLVLLIAVVVAVVVLKLTLPSDFRLRSCLFFQLTGYYCPGCGGTRAFINLLEGNIVASFIYHPVVLYVAGIFFTFMISHTIEKIERCYYRRKQIEKEKYIIRGLKFHPWYLYGVIVVLVVNMTVKNLLIYMGIWNN